MKQPCQAHEEEKTIKRISSVAQWRRSSSNSIWSNFINSFKMLQLLLWTSRYQSAREVTTFQPATFTWCFVAIKCNELDWNKRGLTACSLSAYHNYVNVNPFASMPFIIRKGEVGHRRHARSVVSPRPSLFVFTQASGAGGHDNSN